MKTQTVKRVERLLLSLVLRFPDVNRGKSYKDSARKFTVSVNGVPEGVVDMTTVNTLGLKVRLRSLIRIEKQYGNKTPDAVIEYRVGENFFIITNQTREQKRVAVSFEENNLLDVKDDIDFKNLKDIS